MNQTKKQPLISKEEFVRVMNFMKDHDKLFDDMSKIAEKLSPGFYCDFLPNFSYNSEIIKLLNILIDEPCPEDSLIDYFICELNWGRTAMAKEVALYILDDETTIAFDLSSIEKLYDVIVEVYFTDRDKYYDIDPLHEHKRFLNWLTEEDHDDTDEN